MRLTLQIPVSNVKSTGFKTTSVASAIHYSYPYCHDQLELALATTMTRGLPVTSVLTAFG